MPTPCADRSRVCRRRQQRSESKNANRETHQTFSKKTVAKTSLSRFVFLRSFTYFCLRYIPRVSDILQITQFLRSFTYSTCVVFRISVETYSTYDVFLLSFANFAHPAYFRDYHWLFRGGARKVGFRFAHFAPPSPPGCSCVVTFCSYVPHFCARESKSESILSEREKAHHLMPLCPRCMGLERSVRRSRKKNKHTRDLRRDARNGEISQPVPQRTHRGF